MIDGLEIRASAPSELHAIEALYTDAFPSEDLSPLVRDLLTLQQGVLSLIGTVGSCLIAHVIFTKGCVDLANSDVALLGPLAVASAWQRKGVGSCMVRSGLQRLQHDGIGSVLVLGDPAYYQRFGFSPGANVDPPYALPKEWADAWQCLALDGTGTLAGGTLSLPKPWLRKELWMP